MQCRVGIDIAAPPARVWSLLTAARDFPRWNSTVARIDGDIALGQKLGLQVPAAPGRTFRPTVIAFEPLRRMVWAEGTAPMFRGARTFVLTEVAPQSTRFEMDEVFSGVMLPLIKGSLPEFGPVFERYAADLKREAERKDH